MSVSVELYIIDQVLDPSQAICSVVLIKEGLDWILSHVQTRTNPLSVHIKLAGTQIKVINCVSHPRSCQIGKVWENGSQYIELGGPGCTCLYH